MVGECKREVVWRTALFILVRNLEHKTSLDGKDILGFPSNGYILFSLFQTRSAEGGAAPSSAQSSVGSSGSTPGSAEGKKGGKKSKKKSQGSKQRADSPTAAKGFFSDYLEETQVSQ